MHLDSIWLQIRSAMLAALLLGAAGSLFSQVVPAASQGGLPVAAGAGFSSWDVDWAHGRMGGGTLWVDFPPPFLGSYLPHLLDGLGIEIEARDVSLGAGEQHKGFRQRTIGGGAIYTYRRYRNFHPYVKGLLSFGAIDYGECLDKCNTGFPYTHDSRSDYAAGGGIEYRVFRHIWARADYEYQAWPKLTGQTYLDPQGFTFGAMYDFRPEYRFRVREPSLNSMP